MAYRLSSIEHFFENSTDAARYVVGVLKRSVKAPTTFVLTTTIRPEKSGGYYVTFVIDELSEDTEMQDFLGELLSIYPDLLQGGLHQSGREAERNVNESIGSM